MDDNLNLTQEVKQRYESIYTGVFYERYVLGLWVVAEGAIYPNVPRKKRILFRARRGNTINIIFLVITGR